MNIREVKKVVKNLNSLVNEYEKLSALKKFIERPENAEYISTTAKEQVHGIQRRMSKIETEIEKSLNF